MAINHIAASTNRLSEYAMGPGNRAYCYAELAVSSQRWPRPSPVLIVSTDRGMASLNSKIPRWNTHERSPNPVLTGPDVE